MYDNIVMKNDENHTRIRSLKKAIDILNLLAEWESLGLTEIAAKLGIPKSTAQGLLYTLRDEGLIRQSGIDNRYRLGPRLFELGSAAARAWSMRERAAPYLESLRENLGHDALLYILSDGWALCIASAELAPGAHVGQYEGRRFPLHCTAPGKAILAYLPAHEAQTCADRCGYTLHTRATLGNWELLLPELERIRHYGYAIEVQEYRADQRAIATPVFGHGGELLGALGVVAPKESLQGESLNYAIKIVSTVALGLSRDLGYR